MGIMVYVAIWVGYKCLLIIYESSINDLEYRQIISESSMLDVLNGIYEDRYYILVQDGVPTHTSQLNCI